MPWLDKCSRLTAELRSKDWRERYCWLPRLINCDWDSPALVGAHFMFENLIKLPGRQPVVVSESFTFAVRGLTIRQ